MDEQQQGEESLGELARLMSSLHMRRECIGHNDDHMAFGHLVALGRRANTCQLDCVCLKNNINHRPTCCVINFCEMLICMYQMKSPKPSSLRPLTDVLLSYHPDMSDIELLMFWRKVKDNQFLTVGR